MTTQASPVPAEPTSASTPLQIALPFPPEVLLHIAKLAPESPLSTLDPEGGWNLRNLSLTCRAFCDIARAVLFADVELRWEVITAANLYRRLRHEPHLASLFRNGTRNYQAYDEWLAEYVRRKTDERALRDFYQDVETRAAARVLEAAPDM